MHADVLESGDFQSCAESPLGEDRRMKDRKAVGQKGQPTHQQVEGPVSDPHEEDATRTQDEAGFSECSHGIRDDVQRIPEGHGINGLCGEREGTRNATNDVGATALRGREKNPLVGFHAEGTPSGIRGLIDESPGSRADVEQVPGLSVGGENVEAVLEQLFSMGVEALDVSR